MRFSTPHAPHPATTALPAAAVAAAMLFATAAPAHAWVDPSTGLDSPTNVTRPSDIPEKNWLPGHRGVDLAMRPGQDVVAAEDGDVAFVGVVVGTPVVSIVHPGGIRTTYQPVRATVAEGDRVAEGQVIGTLARPTATFARDHDGLHWGALTGPDTYIDPLTLLQPPRIRLKPLDRAPRPAASPRRGLPSTSTRR